MIPGQTTILAGVLSFGLGALVGGAFIMDKANAMVSAEKAKCEARVDTLQRGAAEAVAEETRRVMAVERERNQLATTLELAHADHREALDEVLADNRRLATQLGGLRDPGRTASSCTAAGGASATSTEPAEEASGGRLSAEATEFLLEFARDADRAASYANTCYDWIGAL